MKINGIENVTVKEMMSILTKDGKESYKNGSITKEDLVDMYRTHAIKKLSKIGSNGDTFNVNLKHVPDNIYYHCSFQQIADVVDALYEAYGRGKNEKKN